VIVLLLSHQPYRTSIPSGRRLFPGLVPLNTIGCDGRDCEQAMLFATAIGRPFRWQSQGKAQRDTQACLERPDLKQSKSAVLNSLATRRLQRTNDHTIREFIEWYCSEPGPALNKAVVPRYRISLEQRHCTSTIINLRLAAVRRLAYEAADCGLLNADLAA
jgi:hypothetical protein